MNLILHLEGDLYMNESEYKRFYDQVGKRNGWDFSKLQITSEGIKWDFYEEVLNRCKHTDVLLDIGTGGGESVLPLAPSLAFITGIDRSGPMVETANDNLEKSGLTNVEFLQMSADDLQFPVGFFDVVACRHAPFNSMEVAKVLKKGGIFLTQQVSEADKLNVKTAFGRGQSFGEIDGISKEKYMQSLEEAGFANVQALDYNATDYYHSPEDLIFLLKHTPIIPHFGQQRNDFDILKNFMEANWTRKGICTNSKRFLIIAKR